MKHILMGVLSCSKLPMSKQDTEFVEDELCTRVAKSIQQCDRWDVGSSRFRHISVCSNVEGVGCLHTGVVALCKQRPLMPNEALNVLRSIQD